MSVFSCKTVNNTVVRLENTKKGFSENDLDFIQKHMGKGTSSNASLGGVQDTLGEYIKYTMYKLTTSNNVEKKKKRKKK